jgi:hypothetical protein
LVSEGPFFPTVVFMKVRNTSNHEFFYINVLP